MPECKRPRALLARVGQGIIDIEDGRASPPSPEGVAYNEAILIASSDWTPAWLAEAREDLAAYFLRYQDLGLPLDAAVRDWAEEWSLT